MNRSRIPASTANPGPSRVLMFAGYVCGGIGLFLGSSRLGDGGAEAIEPVCLLTVGVLGIISFVRHAIFHRSDAARMKWDMGGRTNNFQIEVGMANMAWGLVGMAAVVGDWGVAAQAGVTAVFGLYLLMAASLHFNDLVSKPAAEKRSPAPAIATGALGGMLVFFALAALSDAGLWPF